MVPAAPQPLEVNVWIGTKAKDKRVVKAKMNATISQLRPPRCEPNRMDAIRINGSADVRQVLEAMAPFLPVDAAERGFFSLPVHTPIALVDPVPVAHPESDMEDGMEEGMEDDGELEELLDSDSGSGSDIQHNHQQAGHMVSGVHPFQGAILKFYVNQQMDSISAEPGFMSLAPTELAKRVAGGINLSLFQAKGDNNNQAAGSGQFAQASQNVSQSGPHGNQDPFFDVIGNLRPDSDGRSVWRSVEESVADPDWKRTFFEHYDR